MSHKGLVAVFTGIRKPFEIREFPVPDPEPEAILVKIRSANVCGSDLHAWRGEYDITLGQEEPFCLSMGHEMAGEISKLGSAITHDALGQPVQEGDRIAYQYFVPCGKCRGCLQKKTPRCTVGMRYRFPPTEWPHFNAAYGQYFYLRPGQTFFKVPDNVPDDLAGSANCALSQVIDGLDRTAVGIGDTVVIQGAGGLGIYSVAVAREKGVSQIIVIDGNQSRLALAKEFGADVTIDLNEFQTAEARVDLVKELTGGEGADVVMELVGYASIFPEGIDMLCQGGVYLEIGNINQKLEVTFNPAKLVHGGKTVLGLMWYKSECLQKALAFLSSRQEKYPFHKIMSHRYPLTEINRAYAEQDAGVVQRAALLPWEAV